MYLIRSEELISRKAFICTLGFSPLFRDLIHIFTHYSFVS